MVASFGPCTVDSAKVLPVTVSHTTTSLLFRSVVFIFLFRAIDVNFVFISISSLTMLLFVQFIWSCASEYRRAGSFFFVACTSLASPITRLGVPHEWRFLPSGCDSGLVVSLVVEDAYSQFFDFLSVLSNGGHIFGNGFCADSVLYCRIFDGCLSGNRSFSFTCSWLLFFKQAAQSGQYMGTAQFDCLLPNKPDNASLVGSFSGYYNFPL